MNSKPTFSFDYLTRPNKNIERKLLFDLVSRLVNREALRKCQYIGLGSIWFVDFCLAHKLLGISDMVSIENKPEKFMRAVFNQPFSCIRVVMGDTTNVLPSLFADSKRKQRIVWLDHEGFPDADILEDIRTVCSSAAEQSVLLLTVNAHRGNLSRSRVQEQRENELRLRFGNVVPSDLPPDWDNDLGFPKLLGQMLIDYAKHATIKAGRKERFHPVVNMRYRDGAPMVTVGGVIQESPPFPADVLGTREEQYNIEVPILTVREKLALDKVLPCSKVLSENDMKKTIGFPLRREEFEAYRKHYHLYPVFHELAL